MQQKSMYTKSLGMAVARKASRTQVGKYHVVPVSDDSWSVVSEGNTRPVRTFATQGKAVASAIRLAMQKNNGEVVVHTLDGRISRRMSF